MSAHRQGVSQDGEPSTPKKKHRVKTSGSSPTSLASALFDDDEDVDDVSSSLKRSSGTRKRSSSDAAESIDLETSPVRPKKKKKVESDLDSSPARPKMKKKSARDEAFKQEKARIKMSPIKKKLAALSPRKNRKSKQATIEPTAADPSAYATHATLIYNVGTTETPLLRQHPLIRRVARAAIQAVTERLVLERAWEKDVVNREGQGPKVLRDACRALVSRYPSAKDVYNRLKEDDVFARHLSQLPMDRLSTLRAPAKAEADLYISYFKLGLGEECKTRVDALFQKHSYIFPGKWTGDDGVTWLPEKQKPYGNPTLAYILKSGFFRTSNSTGSVYADRFPEHDGKREIPKSLLALAATGLYASLYQQQMDTTKRLRFHGNSFASVYNTHLQTLDKMEFQSSASFHRIMSALYVEVRGGREEVSGNDDIYSVCELD